MKPYIEEFQPNEDVLTFFLITDAPQVRKSKKDKEYLVLKLHDKSGTIDARMWDIPKELDVKLLKKCIVKVRGRISEWDGSNQITINQMRIAIPEDGYDLVDFFEMSARDPEEMFKELEDILEHALRFDSPIKSLLFGMLYTYKEPFCKAAAAKSIHHNYIGGLLEHVLSLCKTAIPICERYNLGPDLMLGACVLHDIGKIYEMSSDMGVSYTVRGTLLGHISIGMDMVSRAMDEVENFPPTLKMSMLHLIASHHGLLEYGSPKVPLMREAIAFHLIDMLDSRIAICDRALKGGINEDGLTEWVKELGGPLYKMLEEEKKETDEQEIVG